MVNMDRLCLPWAPLPAPERVVVVWMAVVVVGVVVGLPPSRRELLRELLRELPHPPRGWMIRWR